MYVPGLSLQEEKYFCLILQQNCKGKTQNITYFLLHDFEFFFACSFPPHWRFYFFLTTMSP